MLNGAVVMRRRGTPCDKTERGACDGNHGRSKTGGGCVVNGEVLIFSEGDGGDVGIGKQVCPRT